MVPPPRPAILPRRRRHLIDTWYIGVTLCYFSFLFIFSDLLTFVLAPPWSVCLLSGVMGLLVFSLYQVINNSLSLPSFRPIAFRLSIVFL